GELSREDASLAQRVGELSRERRAVRASGLHLCAGTQPRRAPYGGYPDHARARLSRWGFCRCAPRRLLGGACRRAADPVDARSFARAAERARRESFLSAFPAASSRWRTLGGNERGGARSSDRYGHSVRAELPPLDRRGASLYARGARDAVRSRRRRYLSRCADPRSALLGAAGVGLRAIPDAGAARLPVRLGGAPGGRRQRRAGLQRGERDTAGSGDVGAAWVSAALHQRIAA